MAIPQELKGYVISFDTETAVLGDHVIELGVSIFKDGQLYKEWGTFVRNRVPIDPNTSKVHNIYESDLEDAPYFSDIAWFIYNTLNSADVHLAYNYEYDRGVLLREFARSGMQFPVKPMVDPLDIFRKYYKFRKGKKLIDAAEEFGIPYMGAHRAVNDATMAAKVLFKMAATKVDFPKNIKMLIKKQREMVEAQHIDFYSYRKRMGQELPRVPIYEYFEVSV